MARKRSRSSPKSSKDEKNVKLTKKQKLERRRAKLKAWREKKQKEETKTKMTLSTSQSSSKPYVFLFLFLEEFSLISLQYKLHTIGYMYCSFLSLLTHLSIHHTLTQTTIRTYASLEPSFFFILKSSHSHISSIHTPHSYYVICVLSLPISIRLLTN